jgi:hypothetical protein
MLIRAEYIEIERKNPQESSFLVDQEKTKNDGQKQ